MTAEIFTKPTLVKGQPAELRCVELAGQVFSISGGPLRVMRLEDEWYEDLIDPQGVLDRVRAEPSVKVDIFTFWQRPPDYEPRHDWMIEMEDLAVLPLTSYDHWWKSQINAKFRNRVRKAGKLGVEIRQVEFDEDFVRGMTAIFNESPVRQGKRFWHYGKDEQTIRTQFSRYIHREKMIGAYVGEKMIGFVMLGLADRYSLTGQIMASLNARNTNATSALLAKSVEVSIESGLPHLVYYHWSDDSLGDFKKRCGFERQPVPRYYVPLTKKGELAMRWGFHKGWRAALPPNLKARLKDWRAKWHERDS